MSTSAERAQRDGISETKGTVENRGSETPAPNRAQGEWTPRTQDHNRVHKTGGVEFASAYGPRVRRMQEVAPRHRDLSLDLLRDIYGRDG